MPNVPLLGSYGDISGSGLMFRNRVINGDMRIDQRNAGASIAVGGSFVFALDRFRATNTLSNTNAQRSTVAPAYFSNSLAFTTGTGASTVAATLATLSQIVEGFNIADFGFGTASAKTVTVSFWVRSSLTGTFAFRIGNGSRSYVTTYSIVASNTWEYKTLTIPGDTTGTWLSNNGVGMYLNWDLGSGSNYNGASANTWLATDSLRVTGTTNVNGTTGATFYLTGVQLEAGPIASPFEYRPIGTELALCQRYYQKLQPCHNIYFNSTTDVIGCLSLPVFMRSNPVTTFLGTISNVAANRSGTTGSAATALTQADGYGSITVFLRYSLASAGTAGQGSIMQFAGDAFLSISAEF